MGSSKNIKKNLVHEGGPMIFIFLNRIRRAFYSWRQALTKAPSHVDMPVSDLFMWRKSKDWNTFFELIDVPNLFFDKELLTERSVLIIFFNLEGCKILQKRISLISNKRQTVDIGELVGSENGEIGTFAVFHSHIPSCIKEFDSYLSERGYVSYLYKNSPLRSYVHGNLDAISLSPFNDRVEFLGGHSLFKRSFFLQHQLIGPARYELALINSSSNFQKIVFDQVDYFNSEIIKSTSVRLNPGGGTLLTCKVDELQKLRIKIKSQLVMARPLVFRIQGNKLDVFHG